MWGSGLDSDTGKSENELIWKDDYNYTFVIIYYFNCNCTCIFLDVIASQHQSYAIWL